VPIYYESRISKLSLNASELPKLDAECEEITEGEELTKKERLKTKWAALETLWAIRNVSRSSLRIS
jgi:type I restriction enzyme, R subunit